MIEKIALKFLEEARKIKNPEVRRLFVEPVLRSELLRKIVKKAKNEAVKEKLSDIEAIELALKIKKSKPRFRNYAKHFTH